MLQNNLKSITSFYLQMILVGIIGAYLFIFLRGYGVNKTVIEEMLGMMLPKNYLLISLVLGSMVGIVYATLELIFDHPYFQRHSYGYILLGKLIASFFAVKILMAIGLTLAIAFSGSSLAWGEIIGILRSKIYWVVFVFFLLFSSLISFIRMVSQKFGPGVLWNMFIGKYRNPREEQRIFMFLDLKSSTTLAEKLGHIKFSRLIQDCFADLTPAIRKHHVEIYQYVGDEAILSWTVEAGLENNNCIHCYFSFMEELATKSDYYQRAYGIQPVFKAGIHLGDVTVAEVGVIKREISYHGDVLNTAARIEGKCNVLNQQLLISDELFQKLLPDNRIQSISFGEESLKGKKQLVALHGVTRVEK